MTTFSLQTEGQTLGLGRALAAQASTGDVITLTGPLGAGKTVLARGFVTGLLGKSVDVASPTFTLVNVYDTAEPPIWHFDLYRLESPDDIEELGLDEALASGISLIEWPEHAKGWLPEDQLRIVFSVDEPSQQRTATMSAGVSWQSRIDTIRAKAGVA